ncbi:hypothetical protein BB559_002627 [Furculomyces boomerangus]|uniref:Transcription factor domain-containing protein n=1 Tax=Furculomyces boomerangus TaxID=61424 RepID=A0A2T9YTN6_9FUNG|nr:hypothetical protein BB559_002627 [Furculomyces boomerangus]
MNSNQFEYSNSFFTDTIHGLPIPNKQKLKELSLILPHTFPEIMVPMRLPEFTNKFANKKYPYYFIFAVLAAGINYINPTNTEDDKELETKYATKSIELMKKETDISDPLIIWACVFIVAVYSNRILDIKLDDQAIDTIHGLPIPNKQKLKELSLILPHTFPEIMVPMRLPEFTNKFANKKYPYYFIFAVLAAGINYINPTNTEDDKELETKYATKSIELMKKETDISDPLIIWACVFIVAVYSNRILDIKLDDQAIDIATMAVKKTRLYQLDLNKNLIKFKYGYTEDDLEFRRRVWWVYYFQITGNYIFNGNFITFEQRDIVVDLPRKDFKYRYGGSFGGCNDEKLKLLNYIANNPSDENIPTDFHYLIVNTYSLYKNITSFVTKRWRKDRFDEDGANMRLVLYINQLYRLKEKMDEALGDGFPNIIDKYVIYKEAPKLLLETEVHIINHLLRHTYYSMFICLYQSELVRDHDIKIRPERVKSAKQQCVDASIKQMELMEWYSQNIPIEYQGFPHISWSLNSLLSLANFFLIQDPSLKEKHTEYFNRILSVYKSFDKNSDVVSRFLTFVNYIIKIKTKASGNNKEHEHLLNKMKPFGISEHDLEPWIIPKYGLFLHSFCCKDSNFSTLDIGEYLGEILPAINTIQNETILDLTNNFEIKKSIVFDTSFDIDDFFHEKTFVLDPSFLMVNRGIIKSNLKTKKNIRIQELTEPLNQPNGTLENEHNSKRKKNKDIRVESLLNED